MKKTKLIAFATLSLSALFIFSGCTKDDEKLQTEETSQAQATEETSATEFEMPSSIYDGYDLVWEDDFDSSELSKDDWNIELHQPGWVNNELQEYTDSSDNIYIKDGKLVIKPIKTVASDGSVSYTSGRVNTQNKHDFTYGMFEVKAKVPEGKGFLPAIWLMATDENLYGQWPRCGEIDIMEVLTQDCSTSYSTIHYGNPYGNSQGTYSLSDGSFSKDYHIFSCEWEPGTINYYVDGNLFYTVNDWYSNTEGQGEITYPAPFDQPFYLILNLAVGGNWPGSPDETTDFENSTYEIDYVKVYQKASYDENVTKPAKDVTLREIPSDGNYINNGDFSDTSEDFTDDVNWKFLLFENGKGTPEITDNSMKITTEKQSTVDYGVQIVQADLPLEKGSNYKFEFDAYSTEDRTMKIDVSGPDCGYLRYLEDEVVNLTPEKQRFSFEFTMTEDTDPNARIEYNMGGVDSTADIYISNVTFTKTGEGEVSDEVEGKTLLTDGNYIYNGKFQEGTGRLEFWDINNKDNATIEVTNNNTIRELHVVTDDQEESNAISVSQSDLALAPSKNYELSLLAKGPGNITVYVAGEKIEIETTDSEQNYQFKITTPETLNNKDFTMVFNNKGEYYIDNIRLVEDTLIKNGDFSAGLAGFEPYVDSSISSDVTYVVDSLTEDNAIDFTINNTGDMAWKIQLKQNNVVLEKGQTYTLSFDAKCSINRDIMFAIQRDGTSDNDWTPYSGEKTVELSQDYSTYSSTFTMDSDTDEKSILSISLGAVNNKQIKEQHRICIDNIVLEKVD